MRLLLTTATWFVPLFLSASVFFSPTIGSDPKTDLHILYAGNPGSERTDDFVAFLHQYFAKVTATDTSTYREEESNNVDVTIFDWTRTMDDDGRLRSEWRIQDPPRLSREFDRPALLIGETGGRVTSNLQLKLDWLCLCMYDSAHTLHAEHKVFHHPLPVSPTLDEIETPPIFQFQAITAPGPTMQVWKVQTKNYPHADVGLCHTLYGFEDSPDAEIFARGISMKGIDNVAMSRQANYFHWGFSTPPAQLTPSARRLLVNAICYIARFDGARTLIRKTAIPREYALRNAGLVRYLSNEYRQLMADEIRTGIAEAPGRMPERYEGNIDRFIEDQLSWVKPEIERVLPQELRKQFGDDATAWRDYYAEHLEYLHDVESLLVVDVDVLAYGISNRDVRLLDHCISLLETEQDVERARRVLSRYTDKMFESANDWRRWLTDHQERLFFSDSGGYRFYEHIE